MSNASGPTSNINSSSRYQGVGDVPPGGTDDKTQTATAFIGDRQRNVTVGNPTDVFTRAFSDAARKITASGGPVVRLQVPVDGELQHVAGPDGDGDRAAEAAILRRHIAQLDLPDAAKGVALSFLQQAIAMPANADYMQAIIDTINRVEAHALETGNGGAEVLQSIFIDGPVDDNTKAIVRAILNKSSETRALRENDRYQALHDAIVTNRVGERIGSPNSIRNRSRGFVNALTRLGHDIPDGLRVGLLRHFEP